jgi:hypothetical protein
MISQTVRNENVRFGRHIDIEVSYKIFLLEIPKLVLIFHYHSRIAGPAIINSKILCRNDLEIIGLNS